MQHPMDHEELASRIEKRIDRLENKIDNFLEIERTNRADLAWVKGYIKLSISSILALFGAVLAGLFQIFSK